MPDSPFISIIITAFNRKEFLFQALSSAINQTYDRSKYEIIVVKNFQDEKIDALIEKFGVISIQRGNEIVGSYIAEGIETSRGEILTFLDDDDEFVSEKLESVRKIFSSNPSIGYYHNGIVPIDRAGDKISTDFRKHATEFRERTGKFEISKPLTGASANKLFRAAAYGYLSSITIRRKVMVPFLSYLRLYIESVQDIFTFYCALLSSECAILVVDPSQLTRYRIHGSNVSLFTENSKESREGADDFRILKFLSREEKSMKSILSMSAKVASQDEKSTTVARKMIGYELYMRRANLDMVDPSSNRRKVLSDATKFFSYSFRSRFLSSQLTIFFRSIFWSLFPKTTRRIFVRRFVSRT